MREVERNMNGHGIVIRKFQGQRATFVALKGSDEVELHVGSRVIALAKADWLCLPPMDGTTVAGSSPAHPARDIAGDDGRSKVASAA